MGILAGWVAFCGLCGTVAIAPRVAGYLAHQRDLKRAGWL